MEAYSSEKNMLVKIGSMFKLRPNNPYEIIEGKHEIMPKSVKERQRNGELKHV